MNKRRRRNLSELKGAYERRVFVGGSYQDTKRSLLDDLAAAVRKERFVPVIADEYRIVDESLHDQTLSLLHACRYAVFEASDLSGALMEIERTRDYGTRTLILFRGVSGAEWKVSRMLNSFVTAGDPMVKVSAYMRPTTAVGNVRRWLVAMRRKIYE